MLNIVTGKTALNAITLKDFMIATIVRFQETLPTYALRLSEAELTILTDATIIRIFSTAADGLQQSGQLVQF